MQQASEILSRVLLCTFTLLPSASEALAEYYAVGANASGGYLNIRSSRGAVQDIVVLAQQPAESGVVGEAFTLHCNITITEKSPIDKDPAENYVATITIFPDLKRKYVFTHNHYEIHGWSKIEWITDNTIELQLQEKSTRYNGELHIRGYESQIDRESGRYWYHGWVKVGETTTGSEWGSGSCEKVDLRLPPQTNFESRIYQLQPSFAWLRPA